MALRPRLSCCERSCRLFSRFFAIACLAVSLVVRGHGRLHGGGTCCTNRGAYWARYWCAACCSAAFFVVPVPFAARSLSVLTWTVNVFACAGPVSARSV